MDAGSTEAPQIARYAPSGDFMPAIISSSVTAWSVLSRTLVIHTGRRRVGGGCSPDMTTLLAFGVVAGTRPLRPGHGGGVRRDERGAPDGPRRGALRVRTGFRLSVGRVAIQDSRRAQPRLEGQDTRTGDGVVSRPGFCRVLGTGRDTIRGMSMSRCLAMGPQVGRAFVASRTGVPTA